MEPVVQVEVPEVRAEGAWRVLGVRRYVARAPSLLRALPDGHGIAVEGAIHEFRLDTGQLTRIVRIGSAEGGLVPLEVSRAGDVWYTGPGGVFAWRRAAGGFERVCVRPPGVALGLSPDGTHLATRLEDDSVAIWSATDGSRVGCVKDPLAGSPWGGTAFKLSAGGSWVLFQRSCSAQSGSDWLDWALAPRDAARAASTGMLLYDDTSIALSQDGRAVRFLERGRAWTHPLDEEIPAAPDLEVTVPRGWFVDHLLSVSAGGQQVMTADRLYDASTGRTGKLLDALRDRPAQGQLAVHVTQERAWCLLAEGRLLVEDLVTGAASHFDLGLANRCGSEASFAPGGRWLATREGTSGPVKVWDLARRAACRELMGRSHSSGRRTLVALDDGRVVMCSSDRIDILGGPPCTVKLPRSMSDSAAAASGDGRTLAVRGGGTVTPLVAVIDGVPEVVTDAATPASRVGALAVRPDGGQLAFATLDAVEIWDTRPLAPARTLPVGCAVALTYAADGRVLAVAGSDTVVTLWEL